MAGDLHVAAFEEREPRGSEVIRILLTDDHATVRRSVRQLLHDQPGLEVVAEVADPGATIDELREHTPDVLLIDLQRCDGSGIALIRASREQQPGLRIIVLSSDTSAAFAAEALRTGAMAYVLKEHVDPDLRMAVQLAVQGQRFVSPLLAARVQALQSAIGQDGITPP